jgi:hypothetical protein
MVPAQRCTGSASASCCTAAGRHEVGCADMRGHGAHKHEMLDSSRSRAFAHPTTLAQIR